MLVQESTRIFGEMPLVSKVHKMDWDQFDEFVDFLAGMMLNDPWVPSCIVGLARGGLPLAVALSHRLDVPMHAVTFQTRDGEQQDTFVCPPNALVVDDINDSGLTLTEFMKDQDDTVRTAVLINKDESVYNAYYVAWLSPYDNDVWFEFPWERK